MPEREHTDPKALDHFYNLPSGATIESPGIRWYRRLYTWLKVEVFWAPIEIPSEAGSVLRGIEIHEKAVRGARRLHKLDREEAREVLRVTAMLLDFEPVVRAARRERVR